MFTGPYYANKDSWPDPDQIEIHGLQYHSGIIQKFNQ